MKKVSVIVPVYNVEKYIEECVQSIQNQTEKGIEIILVDDGSTDRSSEICERLKETDDRIFVIHQKNQGVSVARNVGIEKATTDWVMFVDADDELVEGSGVTLKKAMNESQADLCLFGHKVKGKNVIVSSEKRVFEGKQIENIRVEMLKHPTKYMRVWAKLFNRKRMIENGIRFDVDLRLAEDSDFTLQYSQHCKKIELYPECIYSYTINSSSVMHTFDGEKVADYAISMELTV